MRTFGSGRPDASSPSSAASAVVRMNSRQAASAS